MKFLNYLICIFLLLFYSACGGSNYSSTAKNNPNNIRYTKFNMHTEIRKDLYFKYKASYANYTYLGKDNHVARLFNFSSTENLSPETGHYVIPVGSKILITKKTNKGFYFTLNSDTEKGYFEFNEPRMKMSLDTYIEKITSTKPVSLPELSSIDLKGIKQGKVFIGMSRKGVMTALGYPATHRTPSLDSQRWIYWTTKMGGTISVHFDSNGKVADIRD